MDRDGGRPEPLRRFERLPAEVQASLDDLETLNADLNALARLKQAEDNDAFTSKANDDVPDSVVSKRPFCNGFTGCGRIGKRSSLLLDKLQSPNQEPVENIVKRPFCNGFFGCGNPGKRIVFRNTRLLKGNIKERPHSFKQIKQKRFFCNPGAFGCSNEGKRFIGMPLMERLRSQIPGLISDVN